MRRVYTLFLLLTAILSLILPLDIAPLFDLDEGAFSEAIREILLEVIISPHI